MFIKRSSQSAPAFSLSLKKPPTVNKRFGPPLKFVLITVSVIAFIIAVILDVKIRWFDCQVAVCVNKRHKIQMLGVVVSKVNFDCLLLKLLICSPETENIFSVVGHPGKLRP